MTRVRQIKIITFRIILIVLAVGYFCKPEKAFGQIFLGAGPEAMGGAGRAASNALDAQFLNPAGISFSKGTNVGGAFQEGRMSTSSPINNYAFEITDNDPENVISGGVAYVYKRTSFTDHTIYDQDFSLSLGGHIFPTIGFGLMGHRFYRQDSNGPGYIKYNATAGMLAVPVPWLGIALVAYDFAGDTDQILIPTLAAGSNIVIMDIVRLRADISQPQLQNPAHALVTNLGAEFSLGYGCFLRTGGEFDNVRNQVYFTAGFGFEGPRLNLGYAYRNNVNVDGDSYHTFQTWLTF